MRYSFVTSLDTLAAAGGVRLGALRSGTDPLNHDGDSGPGPGGAGRPAVRLWEGL